MFKSTSFLELSQSALSENISFLREQFGREVKLSSVVKGNAYGHGIEHFVPMAEKAGIDHFSVFSGDEAWRVYSSARKSPGLMIMGWLETDEMLWAIEHAVSFWVFDAERVDRALELARKRRGRALLHLEVETGMNRTGLTNKAFDYAIKKIKENPGHLSLAGICTHYAGAESVANFVRVNRQISRFNKAVKKLDRMGLDAGCRHTACSAAAMNYPRTRMDMVRAGIMQYGFWPSTETYIQYIHGKKEKYDPLNRVISWKSSIMSLKKVREGEFVSYGTTYLAREEKLIAVIPVGYSHGFSRELSNQGRVLVHGQRVGVIGMVNMNMLIADVTSIPDVKTGDEVVIIGKQDQLEITVASFSEISNQVNYELLVRIPERTRRIVVA
jgi:alanine racemase